MQPRELITEETSPVFVHSLHIHPRVTADHILTLTVFGAADERARGLCAAMSCHTGSHHEREGLRRRDNAGVCAAAPERRALLSDRSRLTTAAARSAEGGEKWSSRRWDASAEVSWTEWTFCFCRLWFCWCSSAVLGKLEAGWGGGSLVCVLAASLLNWKEVSQKEAQWKACPECHQEKSLKTTL